MTLLSELAAARLRLASTHNAIERAILKRRISEIELQLRTP